MPERPADSSLSARPTRHEPSFRISTGQLGMIVLLASLSVLFAASLIAYAVTRLQNDVWRTTELPGLPSGVWASTALIAGASASLHWALVSARRNRLVALQKGLWVALAFGVAFVVSQALNWNAIAHAHAQPGLHTLAAFTFYLLTGLHAAHVVGGWVPLAMVIRRASRHQYSSSHHEGLELCVQYWHFLGVVWLVMLATMALLG